MIRKIVGIIILFAICLSLGTSVFADASFLDSNEIYIQSWSNVQPQQLSNFFAADDAAVFISETNALIEKEEALGFTHVGTELKIQPRRTYSDSQADPYYVTVTDTFTSETDIVNDEGFSIREALVRAGNIILGLQSKWIWIPAAILGVDASDFHSDYRSGDQLKETVQKVYNRRCYKMYNEILDMDDWYYETQQLHVKVYEDLYTVDANNFPVREEDYESRTFYTEHYFDDEWIDQYVRYACMAGLLTAFDSFP